MLLVNPYLNFAGNTQEAFNFYKSVFGGEFATVMKFKDSPEAARTPPGDQDKLMHIALPIGNNVMMGTDAIEGMGHKLVMGNNINLSVHVDSESEADRVHKGLSAGGTVTMPMAKTFWGSYFGMLIDKFGVNWMISHDANRQG